MKQEWGIAIRMTLVTLVVTGIFYPLAMTGVAQVLFPHRANGSLITAGGRVAGSELIGQTFSGPVYFRGRPSAAGGGYDASISSGSNLGATSKKLRDRVTADVESLRVAETLGTSGPVPADLVSASGSGLDPHVSMEAALWQAPRVSAARGVPVAEVESMIRGRLEPRAFGLLGEPRVNVLLLNLDLDERYGRRTGSTG